MTDKTRRRCAEACAEVEGCGCADVRVFDVGNFHVHLIGEYLRSGG